MLSRRLFLFATAVTVLATAFAAQAEPFTDAAGRTVDVPAGVRRVFVAGPPAATLLYTLAPETLVGWVREPSAAEREFLAEPYRDLPTTGRITGRGNTANLEAVLAAKPDLILDVGGLDPTYASLADRLQAQTGIPYVLLDGSLAETPATYRTLGRLLGAEAQAEELAGYAEATLAEMKATLDAVPQDQRPGVYYGRGPDGLETGLAGSINVEVLEAVGARNVAAAAGAGGLATVSPEQVLAWNPEVILTQDARFFGAVASDPRWQGIAAVRERRIFRAPTLPFGWFDSPPGVNRLIGIRWLTAVLYPDAARIDLPAETRDFYRRFYHVELSDDQVARLLKDATPAR